MYLDLRLNEEDCQHIATALDVTAEILKRMGRDQQATDFENTRATLVDHLEDEDCELDDRLAMELSRWVRR